MGGQPGIVHVATFVDLPSFDGSLAEMAPVKWRSGGPWEVVCPVTGAQWFPTWPG